MPELTYDGNDGCMLYATTFGIVSKVATGGEAPILVLLHGGGPDHHSLVPQARRLADRHKVVLPDIRGYGRSVCPTRTATPGISTPPMSSLCWIGSVKAVPWWAVPASGRPSPFGQP